MASKMQRLSSFIRDVISNSTYRGKAPMPFPLSCKPTESTFSTYKEDKGENNKEQRRTFGDAHIFQAIHAQGPRSHQREGLCLTIKMQFCPAVTFTLPAQETPKVCQGRQRRRTETCYSMNVTKQTLHSFQYLEYTSFSYFYC